MRPMTPGRAGARSALTASGRLRRSPGCDPLGATFSSWSVFHRLGFKSFDLLYFSLAHPQAARPHFLYPGLVYSLHRFHT